MATKPKAAKQRISILYIKQYELKITVSERPYYRCFMALSKKGFAYFTEKVH